MVDRSNLVLFGVYAEALLRNSMDSGYTKAFMIHPDYDHERVRRYQSKVLQMCLLFDKTYIATGAVSEPNGYFIVKAEALHFWDGDEEPDILPEPPDSLVATGLFQYEPLEYETIIKSQLGLMGG